MSTGIDFAERLKQTRSRAARGQSVATRFTKAEEAELTKAAETAGRPLREWLRETLLREARQPLGDPLWTETIANRMLLLGVLRPIATGQKLSPERFDELVSAIKTGKHRVAQDAKAQYKVAAQEEQIDGE